MPWDQKLVAYLLSTPLSLVKWPGGDGKVYEYEQRRAWMVSSQVPKKGDLVYIGLELYLVEEASRILDSEVIVVMTGWVRIGEADLI
jgi:hypothetical protein